MRVPSAHGRILCEDVDGHISHEDTVRRTGAGTRTMQITLAPESFCSSVTVQEGPGSIMP